MKKPLFIFSLALVVALAASPAWALFVNGGFEDGTTNGWSYRGGYFNDYQGDSMAGVNWSQDGTAYGYPAGYWTDGIVSIVSGGTDPQTNNNLSLPLYGNHSVKVNDEYGNAHVTQIWQADTVTASDLDLNDNKYHLRFAWASVLMNPWGHPTEDQPFFNVDVTINGSNVYSVFHTGDEGGWTLGGNWWGEDWYYNLENVDLDTLLLGDLVEVRLTAADCSWWGHGGYAYLDGFGSTYIPPVDNPVPEPATMLLLGGGLLGLGGLRRKLRK
jgi:hypothetical protein